MYADADFHRRYVGAFRRPSVTWGYGGISPETFMLRLQHAVSMHSFLIGMIKAPFMGLIIGVIASIEGLAVEGSAESLGRQVTTSVVKSIFMVIVVDGFSPCSSPASDFIR